MTQGNAPAGAQPVASADGQQDRPFIGCQLPVGEGLWCSLAIAHDGGCNGVAADQLPPSADTDPPHAPAHMALLAQARFFDRLDLFLRRSSNTANGMMASAVGTMADYGLYTAAQITEFLDYLYEVGEQLSIKLDGWSLPDKDSQLVSPGGSPVRLLTAAMVFGVEELAAIAAAGQDPLAWLEALVAIGAAGHARGDGTPLALQNHDPDEDSVVLNALEQGLGPAGLRELAGRVSNRHLAQMLGVNAVPADLLADDPDAARHLAEIRTGQPHYIDDAPVLLAEHDAVAVLRSLIDSGVVLSDACEDVRLLVAAGASDAEEVLALHARMRAGELPRPLIRRAAFEDIAPQEWVPLIERIGDRAATYDKGIVLTLATLAQAAEAGISVRAWDENTRAGIGGTHDRVRAAHAVSKAPWDGIYPRAGFAGRVVELAQAGVSPALVDECYGFFSRQVTDGQPGWSAPDAVIDDILALHQAGLTLPLVTELSGNPRGMSAIAMTVGEVLAALKLGLTERKARAVRENVHLRLIGPAMLQNLAPDDPAPADAASPADGHDDRSSR